MAGGVPSIDFSTPTAGRRMASNPVLARDLAVIPSDASKKTAKALAERTRIDDTMTIVDRGGFMTAEEAIKWTRAQLHYPNLADDEDTAARAVKYVREMKEHFRTRMRPLYQLWSYHDHIFRANSLAAMGSIETFHVPEAYIALENLVPRVEEAILDFDPWFAVRGRDAMDRMDETKIQAFLEWQLRQAKARDRWQPGIRSMFTYQVAAYKVWWERRLDNRVTRHVKVEVQSDGTTKYEISRKLEERVVYEGPAMRMVDPYNLIIDTEATDVDDAAYVGDSRMVELSELKAEERLGRITNVDEVAGTPQSEVASETDIGYRKKLRSPTERWGATQQPPAGSPEKHEATELWCRFDLYDDGNPVECLLTVIDDKVCVRAQENPHDEKIRPYAIARCARDDVGFFNVGVFDHTIPQSRELDIHRSLNMQARKLTACPLVFTEDDTSSLPPTLYGVMPGSVFRGVRAPTFTKVHDTLASAPWVEGSIRADIKRTVGAPELFEGAGESSTATEVERKIREGNRRVRAYVIAFSRAMERVLQLFHALNQQFLVRKVAFRVLGKQAMALLGGDRSTIGPDGVMREVDFEFAGLHNLNKLGERVTGLLNFMNISRDYTARHPDHVDELALLSEVFRGTVGDRLGDEIIRTPSNPDDVLPPEVENQILLTGTQVRVDDMDDDYDHTYKHLPALYRAEQMKNQHIIKTVKAHIMAHALQNRRKEAARSAASQDFPMAQPPREEPSKPASTGFQSGNFGAQMNPGQTAPQETPGPANIERMGEGSRAIPQQQNMR